ncbi:(p)ppGpp synthase/HD superfamily hydrolase [Mesorhizobium soli]|uniref:GTP pyrophosphokinase n=1 Tax=Pseudaminobacter soli (ex Li et al. 2025) TaxID=1295366 RepID=UPI00247372DF|nr:GTP pyrophosphokinase [Mesorhizobium soli]MDH6231960.1 (p)ppGpp synthase/HD superfamily hydrolase [Mesorhizobium soli]
MSLFEEALFIAATAHRGKVDRHGNEYIRHVLRVMGAVSEGHEQIVALLHDVVEKSQITLDDLREDGIPPQIIQAVDAMSRRVGEDYCDFVKRAASNQLALPVKIADLRDNYRTAQIFKEDERMEKYARALTMLGIST